MACGACSLSCVGKRAIDVFKVLAPLGWGIGMVAGFFAYGVARGRWLPAAVCAFNVACCAVYLVDVARQLRVRGVAFPELRPTPSCYPLRLGVCVSLFVVCVVGGGVLVAIGGTEGAGSYADGALVLVTSLVFVVFFLDLVIYHRPGGKYVRALTDEADAARSERSASSSAGGGAGADAASARSDGVEQASPPPSPRTESSADAARRAGDVELARV